MSLDVRFAPIRLAGQYESETAQLALANQHLVAVLVRIASDDLPLERQGWCLEIGFGPCRAEGRWFPTLSSAEAWIRSQIPAKWPSPGQRSPSPGRPRQVA